jgi:AbrB family looped-hinge helix DNA binding protein
MDRVTRVRTTVGRKGRTVIPAAARQAAGIEEGQELVVLTEGPGRLTLATREALQEEVWAGAPAEEEDRGDAVSDVRAMRNEDNRLADAAARRGARRASPGDADKDSIGRKLLHELGVEPDS